MHCVIFIETSFCFSRELHLRSYPFHLECMTRIGLLAVVAEFAMAMQIALERVLQWLTEYLRLTLVLCEIAHSEKSLIYVFQEFSASINKAFIFAAGLGAALSFYGV